MQHFNSRSLHQYIIMEEIANKRLSKLILDGGIICLVTHIESISYVKFWKIWLTSICKFMIHHVNTTRMLIFILSLCCSIFISGFEWMICRFCCHFSTIFSAIQRVRSSCRIWLAFLYWLKCIGFFCRAWFVCDWFLQKRWFCGGIQRWFNRWWWSWEEEKSLSPIMFSIFFPLQVERENVVVRLRNASHPWYIPSCSLYELLNLT